ncbi:MAG TPA: acyl-CoA reductase [Saprospiraceae bacterium]|nr:acyl-CoA reductase [Saprospiraceae bacterium]
MIKIEDRISAAVSLGEQLRNWIDDMDKSEQSSDFELLLRKAEQYNPWFTQDYLKYSFENIINMLQKDALLNWIANYPDEDFSDSDIRVGVIMAGNIPLVGFHDFLSVFIRGKVFIGKLSSQDKFLLPFLTDFIISKDKRFSSKIIYAENLLKNFDAVIATGSNNTSRYFDYYFGKYPNIIRKNRNSIAFLNGDESDEELIELGKDVFYYFGLGCRNVSKLLIPNGFSIPHLLDLWQGFESIAQHTKYFNNYEYNRSLLLINKDPHFDNGFLILQENNSLASPVSVINFEFYSDKDAEIRRLNMHNEQIQCVVSSENDIKNAVAFGKSQSPSLMEYADNVDVMKFLSLLKVN